MARRVLGRTETPDGQHLSTQYSSDGAPLGAWAFILLLPLMVVLAHDSLKEWHIPAILMYWALAAIPPVMKVLRK